MENIQTSSKTTTASFELLFAVLVWGASFIATKIAVREIVPAGVIWLRFTFGVVVLGAAVLKRGEFRLPRGREWAYFGLLGFIGITFHTWLQATALETAQATTAAWIVTTTPVYIALLSWLFLREKLGWGKMLGIGIAFAGVILVLSKGSLATLISGQAVTRGDILLILSSPNWAAFTVLSRWGLKRHPPAWMMFSVMSLGWLFTSVQFFSGGGSSQIANLASDGWLAIGFLGIFCSGLAYIAWYDGLSAIPASQVGAFLYLEPLTAVIVAALVLGEPLLWTSVFGGALIILGVWRVQKNSP